MPPAFPTQFTRFFPDERHIHGYAQVCGILSLALAIGGFLVSVIGVLFITPLAILVNTLALYGGYRKVALITIVIVLVNLIVSPTFWLNVVAGATQTAATANRFLSYFDAVGVVMMFCLIAWPRRV